MQLETIISKVKFLPTLRRDIKDIRKARIDAKYNLDPQSDSLLLLGSNYNELVTNWLYIIINKYNIQFDECHTNIHNCKKIYNCKIWFGEYYFWIQIDELMLLNFIKTNFLDLNFTAIFHQFKICLCGFDCLTITMQLKPINNMEDIYTIGNFKTLIFTQLDYYEMINTQIRNSDGFLSCLVDSYKSIILTFFETRHKNIKCTNSLII